MADTKSERNLAIMRLPTSLNRIGSYAGNMRREEFLQRQRVYLRSTNFLRVPNAVIILYVQILVKSRTNMEGLKYTGVAVFFV